MYYQYYYQNPGHIQNPPDMEDATIDMLKEHFSVTDLAPSHIGIPNQDDNSNLKGEWLAAFQMYLKICHRASVFQSQHHTLVRFSEKLFRYLVPSLHSQNKN